MTKAAEDHSQATTRQGRLPPLAAGAIALGALVVAVTCVARGCRTAVADKEAVVRAEGRVHEGYTTDAFRELEQVSNVRRPEFREALAKAEEFVRLALGSPGGGGFGEAEAAPQAVVRQPTETETKVIRADYERVLNACQRGKTVADISIQMGYSPLYVRALLAACPP